MSRIGKAALAAIALAAALAAIFAATSAAATPPEPTVAQSIALGRALAQRNCGMCHAIGRTGRSANPQAPAFRDLHERMDVEMLGEGLAQGILTGHPAMPEFRFEPYEVVGIVRYLRSIQSKVSVQIDGPAQGR